MSYIYLVGFILSYSLLSNEDMGYTKTWTPISVDFTYDIFVVMWSELDKLNSRLFVHLETKQINIGLQRSTRWVIRVLTLLWRGDVLCPTFVNKYQYAFLTRESWLNHFLCEMELDFSVFIKHDDDMHVYNIKNESRSAHPTNATHAI